MRLVLELVLEPGPDRVQVLVLQERALLQARLEPQVRTQLEPQVQV